MATLDQHACCREKGQGSDLCVDKQDCMYYNILMANCILAQLSTATYKVKEDKKSKKLVASPFLVDAGVMVLCRWTNLAKLLRKMDDRSRSSEASGLSKDQFVKIPRS